jgi:hypothetical protein
MVRPGGSILITKYIPTPLWHWLYRFIPRRRLFGRLEPFLPEYWQEDMSAKLITAFRQNGKTLEGGPSVEYCFAGLYRIMRFNISS